jgi:RNA polymerase sigma factor (sigma-70 family)
MSSWLNAWASDLPLADVPHQDVDRENDELAAAARADPQAFALLYARFVRPIYRYCYVRLGNSEAAEDATSAAFLKAFASISSYHGGQFAAWLFRIAHNTVVDMQRQQRPTTALEAAAEVMDAAPTPEAAALISGSDAAVGEMLAQLSAERRSVLELHLAGWSDPQAAVILGKSAVAVKMLRRRALAQLRGLIVAQQEHE